MNVYIILILSFINMVLSNVISRNIYKRDDNPTYLMSNYTIDFVKNIKLERCYSNLDCPHYSSGCHIPVEMFNDTKISEDANYLRDRGYLINNNIFGYCTYSFICPETKNTNGINNNNCFVQYDGKIELIEEKNLFVNSLPISSNDYSLKESFTKTNVTTPYFCSDKSIRNMHCIREYEISCFSNNNCLTNNCQNGKCSVSNEYYLYDCKPSITKGTLFSGEMGSTVCKKLDQELSNEPSECLSNHVVEGFCFDKEDKSKINFIFDRSNMLRMVLVFGIIAVILFICVLWAFLRKIVLGKKHAIYRF